MKLPERHVPLELARRELSAFLMDFREKHTDMTRLEYLQLLAEEMSNVIGFAVKKERGTT